MDGEQTQSSNNSMRMVIVAIVALVVVAALAAVYFLGAKMGGAGQTSPGDGQMAICQVSKDSPYVEKTAYVASADVDKTINDSLSYAGPCAEYGETGDINGNRFTVYSQLLGDKPYSVGVSMPKESLENLPTKPTNEGLYCFDKDKNGTTDRTTECAGGYELAMNLGNESQTKKGFQYQYSLLNWNPAGHVPPHVYGAPHFDVHFYVEPNKNRLAIRPGECSVMVDCEDAKLGNDMPDAKYIPESLKNLGAQEPAMGNHLINNEGHEWHKQDFDHTFIYGVWDKKITFYEPMITLDYLKKLVAGDNKDACFDVPQPKAWQREGWYATKYCIEYRENREELNVALRDFVYREAS